MPSSRSRRADRARLRLAQLLAADLPASAGPVDEVAAQVGTADIGVVEPVRWLPGTSARGLVLVVLLALTATLGWWVLSRPRGVPVVTTRQLPTPAVVQPTGIATTSLDPSSPSTAATPSATAEVVVDVEGRVRRPGVVRLPVGSRVLDALRAAGGARRGTSTRLLNLARVLLDGEQIWVGANPPVRVGDPAGTSGGPASPSGPVNLNTATVDQLDSLPGIGPVLAQRILDWRSQHGQFTSVDQLKDVSGIGDATFADLVDLVTV